MKKIKSCSNRKEWKINQTEVGWMGQSRRFKSIFCGSDGGSGSCESSFCVSDGGSGSCDSKRKLPGHIESIASSSVKGIHAIPKPVLVSLNLVPIVVTSLLGLCTSEWGRMPRDRDMGVLIGNPIIAIILWDWYLLAAPLSLLWAFWWPPNACELKNFLMQKLHEKTLVAVFGCGSESPAVESKFLPRLRFSHSPGLLSSVPSLLSPSSITISLCRFSALTSVASSPWKIMSLDSPISIRWQVMEWIERLCGLVMIELFKELDQRRRVNKWGEVSECMGSEIGWFYFILSYLHSVTPPSDAWCFRGHCLCHLYCSSIALDSPLSSFAFLSVLKWL